MTFREPAVSKLNQEIQNLRCLLYGDIKQQFAGNCPGLQGGR